MLIPNNGFCCMKILYVTNQRYRSSGVSVFCVELCDALADKGADVKLALCKPDFKSPYPVRHEEILMSTSEVLSRVEQFEWDIVHINEVWSWHLHRIANVAYSKGVPVVWSPHGSLTPWALDHKWLKKRVAWLLYMRRDLSRARIFHVTAQSEVEDMRRLGFDNEVAVLPLGVKFRWTDEELRKIKSNSPTKTILFVSRIHPKKGIDNLIKAWAVLKQNHGIAGIGDWKVKIVGEDAFPEYSNVLKRLCRSLDVENDVEFCGALYGDEKDAAYAEAKLFVLPSHSENFGSVIAEALACGTPVITTKGTPWECLRTNRCGWWVDVGVESLVEALQSALSLDDSELYAMGSRGRALMQRDYDWKSIADKMLKTYTSILK